MAVASDTFVAITKSVKSFARNIFHFLAHSQSLLLVYAPLTNPHAVCLQHYMYIKHLVYCTLANGYIQSRTLILQLWKLQATCTSLVPPGHTSLYRLTVQQAGYTGEVVLSSLITGTQDFHKGASRKTYRILKTNFLFISALMKACKQFADSIKQESWA